MLLYNGKAKYSRLNIVLSNLLTGQLRTLLELTEYVQLGLMGAGSNVLLNNDRLQTFLHDAKEEIWEEVRTLVPWWGSRRKMPRGAGVPGLSMPSMVGWHWDGKGQRQRRDCPGEPRVGWEHQPEPKAIPGNSWDSKCSWIQRTSFWNLIYFWHLLMGTRGPARGRDLSISRCQLKSELEPGSSHSCLTLENQKEEKKIFFIPSHLCSL